jgi:hypothetical protein
MDILVAITRLLNGRFIYAGPDTKPNVVAALDLLTTQGEVIECRTGNSRWWTLREGAAVHIRERAESV